MEGLARRYPDTDRITAEMDNLNTQAPGSFYGTFPRVAAKALWDRLEAVETPKRGGWLNVAETEMSVPGLKGVDRRIDDMPAETGAWQGRKNHTEFLIDRQFISEDARIELKRLYPTLQA